MLEYNFSRAYTFQASAFSGIYWSVTYLLIWILACTHETALNVVRDYNEILKYGLCTLDADNLIGKIRHNHVKRYVENNQIQN